MTTSRPVQAAPFASLASRHFSSREQLQQVPEPSLPAIAVPGTSRQIQVRELPSDTALAPTKPQLKVAYAQIRCEPGFLEENAAAHRSCIAEAYRRGCHMVQFPELSMTSYACHDLFLDRNFLRAQRAWIDSVRDFTRQVPGLTVVLGGVDVDWTKTRPGDRPWGYNSLFAMRDGEVLRVFHKKLLPNYDIFDELRWFEPGEPVTSAPATPVVVNGVKVGFLNCEEVWTDGYPRDPVQEQMNEGVEFLSHSAASPGELGKNSRRADLASRITDTHGVPFGSVNMVGCYDGYEGDVPFDGRGLVRSARGEWLAMGTPFKEELLIVDPFHTQASEILDLTPVEEVYESAVSSTRDFFGRLERVTGRKHAAVLGMSGGIDSGLVAVLLADALGPDQVHGISLPTEFNSEDTKSDARIGAERIGMHFQETPIQKVYEATLDAFRDAVEGDPTSDGRIPQNLQARIRTMAIMAYAMRHGGIMINTGNKTERFTNNFTIYADSAGTIAPIADLDKDRVYELARYVNRRHGREVIPLSMIEREASAELAHGQVDAAVMGDRPERVAPHVRALIEGNVNDARSAREVLGEGVDSRLIDRWYGGINASEWKGRQLTPATRVTPRSAGFNRRIPINHGWRGQLPE